MSSVSHNNFPTFFFFLSNEARTPVSIPSITREHVFKNLVKASIKLPSAFFGFVLVQTTGVASRAVKRKQIGSRHVSVLALGNGFTPSGAERIC